MSDDIPQPSRWRRLGWLLGLPVLAVVWAGASFVTQSYLDATLKDRVATIIRDCGEAGGEPWLRVDIDGRDLVAHGEASDAPMRNAALERLAAIADARRLVDRTGVIERASPFVWRALLADASRIELTGSRPAETGASALRATLSAKLPTGTRLDDETRAARGASPAFQAGAAFALTALRGLKPGAVATLSDTVIALEGEARDAEAYRSLTDGLVPPQGFNLGRMAILAPYVDDFRYGIERRPDGGTIVTGYVVSEALRGTIRAALAASAPTATVDDRMQTARGLPAAIDAEKLGLFMTRLAALLHQGSAAYADGAVSVSGVAIDSQAVGELEALMRDERPAGVSAGRVALTARTVSPYAVTIARDPDTITIGGHLPSAAARAEVLASFRRLFIRETVRDTTRIAEGGPDGLMPALKAAVAPLAKLARGQVEVADTTLRLVGEGLYGESARRIETTLPTLAPRGWTVSAQVTSPDAVQISDAASCTRLFAEAGAHPIRFATASSELKPDFYPVLDALADLARRCPDRRIEVVGHADPAGSPAPQVAALPEYTASIKPKEKPQPAKAAAKDTKAKDGKAKDGKSKDASAKDTKTAAKPEPDKAAETPAEPKLDLAQQRAMAIVDYLLKAGVEPARVVWNQTAQPLPQQQGIGFAFRS